ncbi:ABC transporter substrate-binding protein [Paenibacillus guangzhouensis]|uniref:ABC transporter substrate-binding protein n=1 Tax=Paenibacillus guangzhouensis TaxID=1473112 RepID=UPI001D11F8EA|nr:extracellular solute-binding protein [Paenibacillus guangzhouensis]
MKTKRKNVLLLTILALTMIVSACGSSTTGNEGSKETAGSQEPATNSTAETKEAPVTMTVQFPKSDNLTGIEFINKRMDRFKAQYPNVTLKKNDWQYAPNEIGIKMAAHQAPSFYRTPATEGKVLLEHQWLTDLTPYLANYNHANDFNEKLASPFMIDGKMYAIPANGYIMAVMINKKLFEAKNIPVPTPDWTWDDFYAAAKGTADPAKGIAGFAMMAKGNEGGWNWTNFLYAAGGTTQQVAAGKVTSAFNSDAGVKAMEFMKKLRWEGNALPQNWALNFGDVYNLFKQGRAAMVLGDRIEDAINNGGMKKEDLIILPIPSMEKGGDHTGVLGGNYDVINPQESPETQQMAFNYVTFDLFKDSGLDELKLVLEDRKAKGQVYLYGAPAYYKPDSEYGKKIEALVNEYPDNVFRYDPEVTKVMKGVPEPSYNGQETYAALTNVLQEIFSNKDADVKKLLDMTAKKFDEDVLSKVVVQ